MKPDEEDELLEQLPKDSIEHATVLGHYGPGEYREKDEIRGYVYNVTNTGQPPIALCRKKYKYRAEAQMRMNSLCIIRNKRPVHDMFQTARHWVLPIVDGPERFNK